jgi:hypothetical protein
MPTFAPHPESARLLAELDARVRSAWSEYRDGLDGLSGREYDDHERAAWDQLQATLRDVDGERGRLADR